MGLIVLPDRRIIQPQYATGINSANPLTRGLGYLYNCALSQPRNLVSPLDGLIGTIFNGRVPYGPEMAANVGSYVPLHVPSPGIAFASGADFTIVVRVPYASLEGNNPGIVRAGTGSLAPTTAGSGSTFFIFQGLGSYRPWLRLNGTDAFKPSSGPQLSVGKAYTIAIAVRSGVGASVAWNGSIQHTGTFSTTVPSWASSYWGAQSISSERVGPLAALAVWPSRALSNAELCAITRENAIWSLFPDDGHPMWVEAASGAITGTAAFTESSDTAAATGRLIHRATAAFTEANDTAAASGRRIHYGSVAFTESNDTAAASGSVGTTGVYGDVAFTESDDTLAALGRIVHRGTATITEADDTFAAVGRLIHRGTASFVEDDDTLAASDADPLHGFTQDQLDFLVAYLEANMAIPTAEQIAIAVRSELASELTRISDLAKRGGVVSGTPVVIPPGDGSIVAGDVEIGVSTAEDGTVTLARV